jgi:hypothetical protein
LRDSLPAIPIHLDAIGEEAGSPLRDFHVADCDHQVVAAAELQDLVRQDGGFLTAGLDRQRPLRLRRRSAFAQHE